MADRELRGAVAVVTGAAQGIGRALGFRLAREGCRLALADIDQPRLEQTAAEIAATGAELSTHKLDVADRAQIDAFARDVEARHGGANLVINNAGVAMIGAFDQVTAEDFDWLMAINFSGTVNGTRAFLPILRRQGWGHIVNISSIFGLYAPPGQTAYAASKFAVRGFTEALRHELEGSTVAVSCVHPGGIRTRIAERARLSPAITAAEATQLHQAFEKMTPTTPEAAADRIVRGAKRREKRILIGNDARLIDLMPRLLPSSYMRAINQFMPKL